MKALLTGLVAVILGTSASGQKVDSIYFHLYTDSLKKGTHNYINIDGRLSNGNWKPLTEKDLVLSSDYGSFEGNELVLPEHPTVQKIKIRAVLKSNESVWKERTVWIKQQPDPELPKNPSRHN